jgi:hypothetical protein
MRQAFACCKEEHGAEAWSRCMEQLHGADAWCKQKYGTGSSMEETHGASRYMEQAGSWCKQDHGASSSMEQAEAWSRKKHGVVACIRKKYGAEAWSRSMDR